jgi:hypothetical protein
MHVPTEMVCLSRLPTFHKLCVLILQCSTLGSHSSSSCSQLLNSLRSLVSAPIAQQQRQPKVQHGFGR